MEISILEKNSDVSDSPPLIGQWLSYYLLTTPSGGAVTLRSQKSVNNSTDFLILRLTEIAQIQKWLYKDFSHKDKGLCCQTDQICVVVKTQGKLKWREEKQPESETASTGVNNDNVTVFSDLTMKTTASSLQTSTHLSYIHMHTQCYKITCIPLTKKIHKSNSIADPDGNSGSSVTVTSL